MATKIYKNSSFAVFSTSVGDYDNPIGDTRVFYKADGNISFICSDNSQLSNMPFMSGMYSDFSAQDGVPFASLAAAKTYLRTVFLDASAGGGGSTVLAPNSKVMYFGDSFSQDATGISGVTIASQNYGYATWLQTLTKSYFFWPVGGQQGVGGNTSTQMVARLGAALAIKPDIVFIEMLTNDIGSVTPATSLSNAEMVIKAFQAIGAKIVFSTIPQRFSPNALSAPNEVIRQSHNVAIKAFATTYGIQVVDLETVLASGDLRDGLHPSSIGAYKWATAAALKAQQFLNPAISIDAMLSADKSYNSNLLLTGTAGSKSGTATGTVASNYDLDDQSIGATTAGSIVTTNGVNVQKISITGSYSGTGKQVVLTHSYSGVIPSVADLLEIIASYKIVTNDPNVVGIGALLRVYNSSFATLCEANSLQANDQLSNSQTAGVTYITRSQVGTVGAGTPSSTSLKFFIILKNQASPTAINFVVQMNRIGIRKIN